MENKRKTDRRTLYTRAVIRESFIALLKTTPLEKISVSELCRLAEINRSTFYLHYSSEIAVFQELENELYEEMAAYLKKLFLAPGSSFEGSTKLLRSLQNNELFLLILGEPTSRFLNNLTNAAQEMLIKQLMITGDYTQRQAQLLASYIVSGGLAVFMDIVKNSTDSLEEDNRFADLMMKALVPQKLLIFEKKENK